jgi:hypothetical protein
MLPFTPILCYDNGTVFLNFSFSRMFCTSGLALVIGCIYHPLFIPKSLTNTFLVFTRPYLFLSGNFSGAEIFWFVLLEHEGLF